MALNLNIDSNFERKNELQQLIKTQILLLDDTFLDDMLPEYVFLMLANNKSESEITAELENFLGGKAEQLTEWLYKTLPGYLNEEEEEEETHKPPLQSVVSVVSVVENPPKRESRIESSVSVVNTLGYVAPPTIESSVKQVIVQEPQKQIKPKVVISNLNSNRLLQNANLDAVKSSTQTVQRKKIVHVPKPVREDLQKKNVSILSRLGSNKRNQPSQPVQPNQPLRNVNLKPKVNPVVSQNTQNVKIEKTDLRNLIQKRKEIKSSNPSSFSKKRTSEQLLDGKQLYQVPNKRQSVGRGTYNKQWNRS